MMFAHPPETALPRTALVLWRVGSVSGSAVVGLLAWLVGWVWWPGNLLQLLMALLIAVVVLDVVLEVVVLLRLRHRHYRYDAATEALRVRQGYLFARHLVIPTDQILYVDVQQGPIARRLGLCVVHIGTLGSVHPLGPVTEAQARAIVARYGTGEGHAAQ